LKVSLASGTDVRSAPGAPCPIEECRTPIRKYELLPEPSFMKRFLDYLWPVLGLVAVGASFWLLYRELKGEAVGPLVWANLKAISPTQYAFAAISTVVAYAALAWYDRIALLHLGVKHISWVFISLCSFTTYALSHNIGASVFSGAMVRYRAYSSKGLSAPQVAVLVALCSITFALGTILLSGIVLTFEPEQLKRLRGMLPEMLTHRSTARTVGMLCLGCIALYVVGSVLRLRPLVIGSFRLSYPRPEITARQLIAAPMELLGAAGIIYFALPDAGNPGFFVVLGVFLASFSAALVSNAPGGLGVFELVFLKAMPGIDRLHVLAALLVFRLFYLLIPFAFAVVVVVLFERRRLSEVLHERHADEPPAGAH
jgi:glycosyltransferase 2 family protein